MATSGAPKETQRSMSVTIGGKRVPLTAEGLERARGEHKEAGKGIVESIRSAVERASGKEA